ncbi:MAG: ABC transporter substrate-binding protein [Patescibacteria group bacterium]|nr:ABC transporter substrate-binding protein [Patescibacteria group bacterium]
MNLLKALISFATSLFLTISGQRVYIEGVVGQPQNIAPQQTGNNHVDNDISSLVFEGLTRIKSDGSITTGIAKSWEISDDKKTYIFHLDPEARFHDNHPVLAEDVVYTAKNFEQLKNLEIEEKDKHTIVVKLDTPFAPLLRILSIGIVPKHLEGKNDPLIPVSAGTYRIQNVKRGTQKIESITLKKHKKERSGPEKIIIKFFQTEEGLHTAAELGELDGFSSEQDSPKCYKTVKATLEGRHYVLLFNLQGKEFLKNADFRRTLATLVDREKIIKEAENTNGRPAYAPLQNSWVKEEIEEPKFRPNTEKQYDHSITITYSQTEKNKKIVQVIKSDWEKTGLTVNLIPATNKNLKEDILPRKDFDVVLIGQEVSRDPDQYNLWHSTQLETGNNLTGFSNMRADKALEMGRTTHDPEKRKEHYQNFQQIFIEKMPAIFAYYPGYTYHIKATEGNLDLEGIFRPAERWDRILKMYNSQN